MDLKNKTVLITAGGTREYIDDVRVITNISTGALGAKLAEEFYHAGCKVHYVHAKQSVMPNPIEGISETARLTTHQIVTVRDLEDTMGALIKGLKVDIVIHSAAVSDFTFRKDLPIKLSSSDPEGFIEYLKQTITETPKIINEIHRWHDEAYLVGFKFTVGQTEEELLKTGKVFGKRSMCDLVIANDKELMKQARDHIAYLIPIWPWGDVVACKGKDEIARNLIKHFQEMRSLTREDVIDESNLDDYITCPRCAGEPETAILDTNGCTMCKNTGRIKHSDIEL